MAGFGDIAGDLGDATAAIQSASVALQNADVLHDDASQPDLDVIHAYQNGALLATVPQGGASLAAPDLVEAALIQIAAKNPSSADVRSLSGTALAMLANGRTQAGILTTAATRDSAQAAAWNAIANFSHAAQTAQQAASLPASSSGGGPAMTSCPDGSQVPAGQPCPAAAPPVKSRAWVPWAVGLGALAVGAVLAIYIDRRHHGPMRLLGAHENPVFHIPETLGIGRVIRIEAHTGTRATVRRTSATSYQLEVAGHARPKVGTRRQIEKDTIHFLVHGSVPRTHA